MALEDAAVLGTIFARLKKEEQIGAFVNAFQEIREDRTQVVNNVDVSNAILVRLPPGPERDARDASIRQSRKDWDEGALQREFEGVAALFAYEAPDAAMVSRRRIIAHKPVMLMQHSNGGTTGVNSTKQRKTENIPTSRLLMSPYSRRCPTFPLYIMTMIRYDFVCPLYVRSHGIDECMHQLRTHIITIKYVELPRPLDLVHMHLQCSV